MRIHVVGAHLPRLDQPSISKFIDGDLTRFKTFMRDRIATGRSSWSLEEVDARALEIADELNADLQTCALFEVQVQGNERRFHASDFSNSSTSLCGWEPAYLSLDGESVVAEGAWAPPDLRDFRVAFYVHEWEETGSLTGPTGQLQLPAFTPVPARLWRLAPYACFD